jgi:hypothetical protein
LTVKLLSRGHVIELVEHREIIDPDGTAFHQFTFAVDGKRNQPWEFPKYHAERFNTEEEFNEFLARSAVSFSQSEYNA